MAYKQSKRMSPMHDPPVISSAEQAKLDKEWEKLTGNKLPAGHHVEITDKDLDAFRAGEPYGSSYMGGSGGVKKTKSAPTSTSPSVKSTPTHPSKPQVRQKYHAEEVYVEKLSNGNKKLLTYDEYQYAKKQGRRVQSMTKKQYDSIP